MNLSRREWLFGSLTAGGFAEIAAAREHARQTVAGAALHDSEFFDGAMAADVEAIATEILPAATRWRSVASLSGNSLLH